MRSMENDISIADVCSQALIDRNAEVLQLDLNIKHERHCQVVGGPQDERPTRDEAFLPYLARAHRENDRNNSIQICC